MPQQAWPPLWPGRGEILHTEKPFSSFFSSLMCCSCVCCLRAANGDNTTQIALIFLQRTAFSGVRSGSVRQDVPTACVGFLYAALVAQHFGARKCLICKRMSHLACELLKKVVHAEV